MDSVEDRLPTYAGAVAFFALLSLPPALLALLGGASVLAELLGPDTVASIRDRLLDFTRTFLTDAAVRDTVEPVVDELLARGRAEVISVGIVVALWSASRATRVMMEALVVAYDLEELLRPGWKRRLIAAGLTLGAIGAGVLLIPVLVAGPRLGKAIAEPLGLAGAFGAAWEILYWPIVALVGAATLATFYHLALPWWTPWRRDFPGALLAIAIWLLGGLGLRLYTRFTILASDSVFGPLAAPVVLLLWLYVTSFAVLLGGELNAEIERMWPTREFQEARAETGRVRAAG